MEQLKANILNLVSGEHQQRITVLQRQVLAGIESEEVNSRKQNSS
jgi:hypothetical protein